MSHDPHRLVTATELFLEWAADHGVRYDDGVKSFDELARDCYQTSDSYRELTGPDLGEEAPTASERMVANVVYARALLMEAAIVARGGVLNPFVDPIEVVDATGWGVPHLVRDMGPRWESTPPPAGAPEPLPAARGLPDHDDGVATMTESALPLRDVPLIVEDLLIQAKRLAEAGGPTVFIVEILDRVAALREGRG